MREAGRRLCGALLVAWTLGPGALTVRADEPGSAMIHIRARSQLRLREGERSRSRDGFRLGVLIQLSDNLPTHPSAATAPPGEAADPTEPADEAGRSFSGQRIRLRLLTNSGAGDVELDRRLIFTDAAGTASFRFNALPSGSYRILASYEGDSERDRSEASLDVDLDRRPAQLDLDVPETLDRHALLPVQLRLRSAGEPAHGPVELSLTLDGKELYKRTLSVGNTGRSEALSLASHLPPSGAVVAVTARFPGDDETAPTEAHRELLFTSQANITLELAGPRTQAGSASGEAPEVAQGGRLLLSGTAFDDLGPLRDEAVDLEATSGSDRRRLGSVLTDGYGRYRLTVEKLQLRVGPAFLSAQVTPRRGHILTGRSAELPITVLPPEPVSLLPFLIPLLATLLGGALALAGRLLRPRLRAWLERLRPEPRAETAELGTTSQPALPTTGEAGVSLGKGGPRTGLTLRRTVDTTIDGVVHDAVFGPVISGAVLQLVATGTASEAVSGADGRFGFPQVKPGRYQVRVEAPGYLPTEFSASVPHRGELRGVTVRLMPMRVQLHSEWQRVATALCGDESKLVTRTPHEVLAELASRRPAPDQPPPKVTSATKPLTPQELQKLRRLTALVEQGYYSQRLCTGEMLAEAERLAVALTQPDGAIPQAELPPVPSGPVRADIRAPGAPRPLM